MPERPLTPAAESDTWGKCLHCLRPIARADAQWVFCWRCRNERKAPQVEPPGAPLGNSCAQSNHQASVDASAGKTSGHGPGAVEALKLARKVLRCGTMNEAITLRLARALEDSAAEVERIRKELRACRGEQHTDRLAHAKAMDAANAWAAEQIAARRLEVDTWKARAWNPAKGAPAAASTWVRAADALPQPRTLCAVMVDGEAELAYCVLWNDGAGPQRRWLRSRDAGPLKLQNVTHWQALSMPTVDV